METAKQLLKKNDRKLSPQEALVQTPGDSDGIAAETSADIKAERKKASGGSSAQGMEVRGASETENTADPAKGREWIKRGQ